MTAEVSSVEEPVSVGARGVALEDVPPPGAWARVGRCRGVDPAVFFPARGDDVRQAKAICRLCPVVDDCRAYGLEFPELDGVWGGLSARERRRPRPEAAPAAAADPPASSAAAAGALYAALVELTEHPGRWARVAVFASRHSASATAALLRSGARPVPPGSWEFRGHVVERGSALYARIVEDYSQPTPSPSRSRCEP